MTDEASQITPFLWTDGCAREAAEFYVSVFRDSYIVDDTALPDDPGAGSHVVSFVIKGQRFTSFDGDSRLRIHASHFLRGELRVPGGN